MVLLDGPTNIKLWNEVLIDDAATPSKIAIGGIGSESAKNTQKLMLHRGRN